MAWPAIKRPFLQDEFRQYVETLSWLRWRPSKIVWHNTAAPSLAQWIKSANDDRSRGLVPGTTRINNLENYFRYQNKWSGCPHLFIPNDFIWEMNPLTAQGTHSPSFNTTAIGIEMVGDFEREDDDVGDGLAVKRNTVFATAVLCSALGLEPSESVIYLHKQDPRTTHDCPGKDIAVDKIRMIGEVANLMNGGEHDPDEVAAIIATGASSKPPPIERRGVTIVSDLNLRRGPGVINESIGSLPKQVQLIITGEAKNQDTAWLCVRTPAGFTGWVAAQYVKQEIAL